MSFFPFALHLLQWSWMFFIQHWMIIMGIALLSVLSRLLVIVAGKTLPTSFLVLLEVIAYFSFYALLVAIFQNGTPAGGILGAYGQGFLLLVSPAKWYAVGSAGYKFLLQHWANVLLQFLFAMALALVATGLLSFLTGNRFFLRLVRADPSIRTEDVPAVEFIRTAFRSLVVIPFLMIEVYALYQLLP